MPVRSCELSGHFHQISWKIDSSRKICTTTNSGARTSNPHLVDLSSSLAMHLCFVITLDGILLFFLSLTIR